MTPAPWSGNLNSWPSFLAHNSMTELLYFSKYYIQWVHSLGILHFQAVILLVESDMVGLNFCHPTMSRSKPNGLDLSFVSFLFPDFLKRIMDHCDSTILSSDERARLRLSGSLSIFYCLLIWIHSVVVVVVCFVAIARMIWVAELLVMICIKIRQILKVCANPFIVTSIHWQI